MHDICNHEAIDVCYNFCWTWSLSLHLSLAMCWKASLVSLTLVEQSSEQNHHPKYLRHENLLVLMKMLLTSLFQILLSSQLHSEQYSMQAPPIEPAPKAERTLLVTLIPYWYAAVSYKASQKISNQRVVSLNPSWQNLWIVINCVQYEYNTEGTKPALFCFKHDTPEWFHTYLAVNKVTCCNVMILEMSSHIQHLHVYVWHKQFIWGIEKPSSIAQIHNNRPYRTFHYYLIVLVSKLTENQEMVVIRFYYSPLNLNLWGPSTRDKIQGNTAQPEYKVDSF